MNYESNPSYFLSQSVEWETSKFAISIPSNMSFERNL
jgi:hypothetical protein